MLALACLKWHVRLKSINSNNEDTGSQTLPANAQYAVPTHSFSRTKATSDIPPFIIPTKKREMAKNSYEGENPFAMANKMSRAKPGK